MAVEREKIERAKLIFSKMLKKEKEPTFEDIFDIALESASSVTDVDEEIDEIYDRLIGLFFFGKEEWFPEHKERVKLKKKKLKELI